MKRETREGSAWFKFFRRHFGIFQGDPTTQQLEMLAEIQGRLRLVVKTRWILLLLLTIYGIYAGGFFCFIGDCNSFGLPQVLVLLASLTVVIAYNLLYQIYYRELSHFVFVNHVQILLDIIFVTVLVHFSGGVLSWFWTVFLILTLEASFLLERKGDAWFIGAVGGLMYGALITLEFYDVIPPLKMPFINPELQHNFIYEMLMWFWVSIMNGTVAIMGAFLMSIIRDRERELRLLVIKDQMSNLYNRAYFFKTLNSEIQRSRRYGRVFSLIFIDLDNFKQYNDTYGHLEGDKLLKAVAQVFRSNVRRSETDPPYDVDVPCRYGGEEFAIVLPETPLRNGGGSLDALSFAERVRKYVEEIELDGRRITVSIGVAAFPTHGSSPDALVKAADDALYRAKEEGKNRVVCAA